MASKKIKLADSTKARIKKNFDDLDPNQLKGQVLQYYNKVKAGKVRSRSAYRTKGGFSMFPAGFTEKYIKPVLREKGIEPTPKAIKEYFKNKRNKEQAFDLLENDVQSWFFGTNELENAFSRMTPKTKIFINRQQTSARDFSELESVSQADAILQMQNFEKWVIKEGAFSFKTNISFRKDFSEMIIYLPEYESLEDLIENEEEGDIFIAVSSKKAKNDKDKENKKPTK